MTGGRAADSTPARAAHALLDGVIDYAGTFPPARLSPSKTIANYASYRLGPHAWLLGSLVIPAAATGELTIESREDLPWPIHVVVADAADVDGVLATEVMWHGRAKVAAIEFAPIDAADIPDIRTRVPPAIKTFFEIALPGRHRAADGDMYRQLDAIAGAGGLAKMRTGGVTGDAFPSALDLYHFLCGCAERDLACKATAGLHHVITGRYSPTGEGGEHVPMFGFLNVCVLAAMVRSGCTEQEALDVLAEADDQVFRVQDDVVAWRERRLPTAILSAARRTLFQSFGSCSFGEPIDELSRIGLI